MSYSIVNKEKGLKLVQVNVGICTENLVFCLENIALICNMLRWYFIHTLDWRIPSKANAVVELKG